MKARGVISLSEGTTLRDGVESDLRFVDSLRKSEGSALGFIPIAVYESVLGRKSVAGRDRYRYSRMLITEDNSDLTGFCYVSYSGEYASIVQIVVRADARRWHRALMMSDEVERDCLRMGKRGIKCRVAYDLESNFFWRAIGYIPVRQVTSTWLNQKESKSKRPLWLYKKPLGNDLFRGREVEGLT